MSMANELPTADIADRLPPYDVAAETCTLGAILAAPQVAEEITEILPRPEMFFDERSQAIYAAMLRLVAARTPIDTQTLVSQLRSSQTLELAGGLQHIGDVMNSVPSAAHGVHYAKTVRDKARLRGVITACTDSLKDVYESGDTAEAIMGRTHQRIVEVVEDRIADTGALVSNLVMDAGDRLMYPDENKSGGILTGFPGVDAIIGSMQPKHLITLEGESKHGKTALGLNIVANAAIRQGKPSVIFEFEMSREELTERLLIAESQVTRDTLRGGRLNPEDRERFAYAMRALQENLIVIDDECEPTMQAITTRLRRYKRKYGVQFCMIDYFQLLECYSFELRDKNRYTNLVNISRGAKNLAKEADMPILMLAQANGDPEAENRKPRPTDIEECKKLAKDSNTVLTVYWEYMRKRNDATWMEANIPGRKWDATIEVAFQRNGGMGEVPVTFNAPVFRFLPMSTEEQATRIGV